MNGLTLNVVHVFQRRAVYVEEKEEGAIRARSFVLRSADFKLNTDIKKNLFSNYSQNPEINKGNAGASCEVPVEVVVYGL